RGVHLMRWLGRPGGAALHVVRHQALRFVLARIPAVFFFKQKTAYEIGLGIPAEPLFRSLNATGGGFLTASKQFRHGATSKSRSNTASNSTKHKSPHLSGWRQIISLIT